MGQKDTNKLQRGSCIAHGVYVLPTIFVLHYMHSYLCACKPTQLEVSYSSVPVWHRLTSDVRSGLVSIAD